MLRLFDTAAGEILPLEPAQEGRVSIYACGPTVYGPPHLGHGRMTLTFDILRRYLEWAGNEVVFVSNITDVDDNIIQRAHEEGRPESDVVEEYERIWYEAMDAIGVKRPTEDPHATAWIDQMVEVIGQLVDRGAAYETSDGVYFRAGSIDDYGLLARQTVENLVAGARIEVDDDKESPVDFALWKKAKPGEPSWDSPWGAGRPGWHTECVVMSLGLLGDGFDIHGGGQDLAFPHHENERAQAVALGREFARRWVHNGFIEVDGEKMSKSLGNFSTLTELIETTDPRAFRLLVLRSHYRSPMEVTRETMADAGKALERLDAFGRRVGALAVEYAAAPAALFAFAESMDDNLDTPAAVSLIFDLVRGANALLDSGDAATAGPNAAAALEMLEALGLQVQGGEGDVPADVLALAAERDEARAAKDFGRADAIRDRLQAEGWVVEDTSDGTQVRSS